MDITPIIPQGKNVIRGYGSGLFKINELSYNDHLIVLPDELYIWKEEDAANLALQTLPALEKAELILVGCGSVHQSLPQSLYQHFAHRHIGIEIMTTGAACRTYNVLLAEGRNVAAALRRL